MINFVEIERIVRKLPISYYAGRNISITCSRTAESSFYDLLRDSITISYPAIKEELKNATSPTENTVRATVYHELSHALITPKDITPNPIINVFEDERIETYFEGYYLNVDFKEAIRNLNGWDGVSPADPNDLFSVYYHAMRYRDTTDEKKEWIENYFLELERYGSPKNINIEDCTKETWEYITGVSYGEYLKEHTVYQVTEMEGEINSEEQLGKEHDNQEGKQNSKRGIERYIFSFNNKLVDRDDNFTKAITILFDNFNRKTQGGSAYQTYSGVINPRNIAREDYRYFDRLAKQTGNNKFGSLHLNLFLDCSGSFVPNQYYANQVLKALCEMEDKYPYFTFDVIACGVGQQLLEHHDRAIECNSGTYLTREVEPLFRRLQKPQTMNYNIVMYDGDCAPDTNVAGKANAFGVFDRPNCFIISDEENEVYIKNAVKSARVVITNRYMQNLKDNVIKALSLALS